MSILATASEVFISDLYAYVRNTANNGASPSVKEHAGYYIYKTKLIEYFKKTWTDVAGITNNAILPNSVGAYLNLYDQVLTGSVITLVSKLEKPPTQIFEWDRR